MTIRSRIAFPDRDAMTEDQRRVHDEISAGPRGGVRGPLRLLLHSPRVAQRVQALGEALRWGTSLGPVAVELVILMVARHIKADYVWSFHTRLCAREGLLSSRAVDELAAGDIPAELAEQDRQIAAMTAALLSGAPIGESQLAELTGRIGEAGLIELLCLVGYYHIGGYIAAVAELSAEPGAEP